MSLGTRSDVASICEALVGRPVLSAQQIGHGRNSRVFKITLAGSGVAEPEFVVLKFYRRDPGDARDRLGVEFNGLTFMWHNGVRAVPKPIAADRSRNCAVYEYLDGTDVAASDVETWDIESSVDFLASLRGLCDSEGSDRLSSASEACFTLGGIAASVSGRLARLREANPRSEQERRLQAWLDRDFAALTKDVWLWVASAAGRWSVDADGELPRAARTLSPSDFGFHNTVRRPDGRLAFVDFEYFGWDDPAKTLVDYLLHPGMALREGLKHQFAERFLAAFADVWLLPERSRLVYPLFGLKWCLIILNDFLPDRCESSSSEVRGAQLAKAEAMAETIARTYADNPYVV